MKNRIGYIDCYRFLGIMFMIMGHIGFGSAFDKWIHAFHMPMFFIISGYFYKEGERVKFVIAKRVRTLLLPYAVFGAIHMVIGAFIYHGLEKKQLYSFFICPSTGEIPIGGALWFLPAIFFTEIIYYCLNKLRDTNCRTLAVILITLVGLFINKIVPYRLPYAVDISCVGVGLYHIGVVVKKKYTNVLSIEFWMIVALFIMFSYSSLISGGYVNMRTVEYPDIALFFVNAVGMSIVLLNLSRCIYPIMSKCGVLTKFVNNIGKNSVVYVCLNQLAIIVSRKIIKYIFYPINETLINIMILVLTIFVLKICEMVIVNTRLSLLIGK